jgi:hypothetical protein
MDDTKNITEPKRAPRFPKLGAGHTISKHEGANDDARDAMNEGEEQLTPERIAALEQERDATVAALRAQTDTFKNIRECCTRHCP